MKILGREIKINKIIPLLHRNPYASVIGVINNIRQRTFFERHLGGHSLFPSAIAIEITYLCNLRCKTCWFYGNSGIFKKHSSSESLDFESLKKLIDNVAKYSPYIYLTGGEPLINKATTPTIQYAKKKGLVVGLVTNGTLLNKENAEKLIQANLDFITISLDGNEKTHDYLRGQTCFKNTTQGIKNIIEMRKKSKFPVITLNCTISDYNYKNLNDVFEIAEELQVDILALQHPCFLQKQTIKNHHNMFSKIFGKSNNLIDGYENDLASKIDPDLLYKILSEIKNKNKSFDLRLYQDFSQGDMSTYYKKEKAINHRCISPWFSAVVKPNGDVTPCLGEVMGNIKSDSFMSIWNNKKFKNFRKVLNNARFFPACIMCCGFFLNWR